MPEVRRQAPIAAALPEAPLTTHTRGTGIPDLQECVSVSTPQKGRSWWVFLATRTHCSPATVMFLDIDTPRSARMPDFRVETGRRRSPPPESTASTCASFGSDDSTAPELIFIDSSIIIYYLGLLVFNLMTLWSSRLTRP